MTTGPDVPPGGAAPLPRAPGRPSPALLYLASAHLFLGTALGTIALAPASVAGFWYHPRMVAIVHLVTLGWSTASILGALYMIGPLAMRLALPPRRGDLGAFAALAIRVAGLAAHVRIAAPARMAAGAAIAAAALALFLRRVAWMARHRRPAPKELRRPDYGVLHILQALVWLAAAAVLGLALAFTPPAEWKLGAAMAYGVFALVGFLAQMIVGVNARLLPIFAWLASYGGRLLDAPPPS